MDPTLAMSPERVVRRFVATRQDAHRVNAMAIPWRESRKRAGAYANGRDDAYEVAVSPGQRLPTRRYRP